jgi:hypothetical protein
MIYLKKRLKGLRHIVRHFYHGKSNLILDSLDCFLTFLLSAFAKNNLTNFYGKYIDGFEASPENVSDLIIGANFWTCGRIREDLKPNIETELFLKDLRKIKSKFNKINLTKALKDLNAYGYVNLGAILDQDAVNRIYSLAKKSHVKPTKYSSDRSFKNIPDLSIDNIWDIPFDKTLTSKDIRDILQDPQLLELSMRYLKSPPVVIGSRLYWSFPQNKINFLTPENWHVDSGDGLNFIKYFIYITDVSFANGPTAFIKYSHKLIKRKYLTGRRFTNCEIKQDFPGREKEIYGKRGTVFAVDTRGIHKAVPVQKGERLMFHFIHSADFFGISRKTTSGLDIKYCFGDKYTGVLGRTFYAFSSKAPENSSLIKERINSYYGK